MSRPLPPDSAGLTDLLVRTADAWRNGRALLLLAVAGALFVLLGGTSGLSGQFIVFMIGSLAGLIVLLGGVSAAGVLYMDQARGETRRPLADALRRGANCGLRHLLIACCALLPFVAHALLSALLLLLARIPGVGPLFYVLLFPILALAATALFALFYFVFMLLGPALWSGVGTRAALAQLYAVCVRKPGQAVAACVLLSLLVGVLGIVLMSAATAGTFFVGVFGPFVAGSAGVGGGHAMGMMFGDGGGWAGMVGTGIVHAVVGAAVAGALLLGSCHVWRYLVADIDGAEAESALAAALAGMRHHAGRVGRGAAAQARRAQAAVRRQEPAVAPVCPGCGTATQAGDQFCSHCGRRLDPVDTQ